MPPVEWYYARGNKQMGPVPSVELKRLASVGEIRPEDLVWREGMAEWTLARNVRGLFEEQGNAAAATASASNVANEAIAVGEAAAAGPSPTSLLAHRKRVPVRHPLDLLLGGLRAWFDAAFLEKTAKVLKAIDPGLLAAMFLVAAMAIVALSKAHRLEDLPSYLVVILVLAVLQYAGGKFCDVLEQLNLRTSSSLSSTAFPDFCALMSLAGGLASLIGSPVLFVAAAMAAGVSTEMTVVAGTVGFLFGAVVFIVCGYFAAVVVNLAAMNVSIVPELRAGEEAIGVFAFMLKAVLRLVPAWFAASVICGTAVLGYAGYQTLSTQEGLARALFEVMDGKRLGLMLVWFAAVPVLAYLLFLTYYLGIEVLRALLILPSKIDQLAAGPEKPGEKQGEEKKTDQP